MKIEKENQNNINQYSHDNLLEFVKYFKLPIENNKYFIEISLFTDYIQLLINFSLSMLAKSKKINFDLQKSQVDEQCEVIFINIFHVKFQIKLKILNIQMDQILKIVLQIWNSDKNQFQTKDSFWIDFKKYLNKKISNSYKLSSIQQLKHKKQPNQSQLNHIFLSRFFQILGFSTYNHSETFTWIDHIQFFNSNNPSKCQKFYNVLGTSSNIFLICSFLNIKSIAKLKQLDRYINQIFFGPEMKLYKGIYDFCYGKTGFSQTQLNWKKSLNSKREEIKKYKTQKNKPKYSGLLRIN